MSELVISLLQRGVADLLHSPFSSEDTEAAAASLPPPMLPANHQALSDRCFMGQAFRDNAVIADPQPDNWTWVNEAKASLRPKWGYVSYTPGSVLRLRVNTTASAGALDQRVLVQLAHLRSYEHMGQGSVTCAVRCDAAPCPCPHMVTCTHTCNHACMHACVHVFANAAACSMMEAACDCMVLPPASHLAAAYCMLSVCSACVTCRCESGCVCDESRFNGHTYDQTSLLVLHSLYVSQADECVLAIKVRHLPVVGGALCVQHSVCCTCYVTSILHAVGHAGTGQHGRVDR
jgi:hypothetical protein